MFVVAVLILSKHAEGQVNAARCDAALVPTIENATSDYALAQSYMYVNAVYEYDQLKRMSTEGKNISAVYKLFGAEYSSSKNSSEFQIKVRDRLTRESYAMHESESRASYRRYLSEGQLSAWSSCVQAVAGSGAVILTAESVSESAFPVRVKWYPQVGVGTETLLVKIQNATIDGSHQAQVQLQGVSVVPFIVVPDSSKHKIVITVEIRGAADTLTLPRIFPDAKPPTPVDPLPEHRTITITASAFLRPLNVALGGPRNIYGADVLLNGPPYHNVPNRVEYEFTASSAGTYLLKVEYAALVARPVRVSLNGEVAVEGALASPTGCWTINCQRLLNQGRVSLRKGFNVLRVERAGAFPHLRTFVFEPVE
jgi:hypothetical protein